MSWCLNDCSSWPILRRRSCRRGWESLLWIGWSKGWRMESGGQWGLRGKGWIRRLRLAPCRRELWGIFNKCNRQRKGASLNLNNKPKTNKNPSPPPNPPLTNTTTTNSSTNINPHKNPSKPFTTTNNNPLSNPQQNPHAKPANNLSYNNPKPLILSHTC